MLAPEVVSINFNANSVVFMAEVRERELTTVCGGKLAMEQAINRRCHWVWRVRKGCQKPKPNDCSSYIVTFWNTERMVNMNRRSNERTAFTERHTSSAFSLFRNLSISNYGYRSASSARCCTACDVLACGTGDV